jgi:excinuclease ABC subunit A
MGQCERCRGAGFEKIEMQFLSDVFVRCPDCDGRRYRAAILNVKVPGPEGRMYSIADLLEASVDEALALLAAYPDTRGAAQARSALELLRDVGLGYLQLGQPINTLSGGESQRLRLVRHVAEMNAAQPTARKTSAPRPYVSQTSGQILFLFDEPTTGLHFEDVSVLLQVFQRLVTLGHSVLVIEHNLELIKAADWIIDLGPEAGAGGGRVVVAGTPETVAAHASSHTGRFLREVLAPSRAASRVRGARRSPVHL